MSTPLRGKEETTPPSTHPARLRAVLILCGVLAGAAVTAVGALAAPPLATLKPKEDVQPKGAVQ